MSKTLRKYQNNAISAVFENLEKGVSSQLICVATGGGKTLIATRISERFKRTLFLCHREELIEQGAISFIREKFDSDFITKHIEPVGFINYIKQNGVFNHDGVTIGLIKADTFQIESDVIIGSVQTAYNRLNRLPSDYFDCVIADECHNYLAKSFEATLRHFKPKLLLGITATDRRGDNLPLSNLFDEKVFEYNIGDGIKEGYLVELNGIKIKTNCSLDKVRTTAGELNTKDLSNEINTLARNNLVADSYLKYASGRKFIAFACDIQHAIDLCDAFIQKGINCTVISSDEELTGDRSQKVKDFRLGMYEGLINVNILTEGSDFPFVSCIINGSPTTSWTRFMQRVGRGTRVLSGIIDGLEAISERWSAIKKSDKKDCVILDITDNSNRHNLVNCHELDKELSPEDRVFITQENREKLLADRLKKSTKLEHTQEADEFVNLLKIPRIKINFDSEGMKKEASEKQLAWLSNLGYNIKENTYSMGAVQQIVGELPASKDKVEFARLQGYDVNSKVLTNNDFNAIQREIYIKQQKKKKK